ncbi:MAG: TrkA family potassium uptake protein [Clostridia bacterium]|nr:TrkA family potassium uptake protein [Clostridia bacterium]
MKSIIVIGLGRFGLQLARSLASQDKKDIIAIDIEEEMVQKASEFLEHCYVCDATNISALKELGVSNVDEAIVAIGEDLEASILTVSNLKNLGVEKIIVRADQTDHVDIFTRLGATDVVVPEISAGETLANKLISDSFLDYYKVQGDYGIVRISVEITTPTPTLKELNTPTEYKVSLVSILRNKEIIIPTGDDNIQPGDIIFVIGKTKYIMTFENSLKEWETNEE